MSQAAAARWDNARCKRCRETSRRDDAWATDSGEPEGKPRRGAKPLGPAGRANATRNASAADGRYSVLRIAGRCAMQSRVLWRSRGAAAERAVSMQAKTPCKGGLNSPRSRAHCSRRPSARSDRIRRQSCDCRAMRRRERNAPSRTGARLGLLWPHFTCAHSTRNRQGANAADCGASGRAECCHCGNVANIQFQFPICPEQTNYMFYTANKIHPYRKVSTSDSRHPAARDGRPPRRVGTTRPTRG